MPTYPEGTFCKGADSERRLCVQREVAFWNLNIISLYQSEVDKRAAQDQCLSLLRKNGVIK